MIFTKRKKRGSTSKTKKYWFSEEGYRIIWRREAFGVKVPARFQTSVRTVLPTNPDRLMWDFTDKRKPHCKTFDKAKEACERHYATWLKACETTGVRGIIDIFGKLPFGYPLWTQKKFNRRVYELLAKPRIGQKACEDDPTPTSTTFDDNTSSGSQMNGSPTTPTNGLVSPAKDEHGSTTLTIRRARSKATKCETDSNAESATEQDVVHAKNQRKPTVRRSSPGSKKMRSTRGKSKRSKKPAKSSRKKKS